jgi:hypothetical protein
MAKNLKHVKLFEQMTPEDFEDLNKIPGVKQWVAIDNSGSGIQMTPEQRKKMLKQIEDLIKRDGEVVIGMVHNFYGPLRGLKYVLLNPNAKFLEQYLFNGWEKIAKDIWTKTKLATRPMILGDDVEFDTEPVEFRTIKEGENFLRNMLDVTPSMEEDPFFFRKGAV